MTARLNSWILLQRNQERGNDRRQIRIVVVVLLPVDEFSKYPIIYKRRNVHF
jgi:hypothetical protein